MNPRDQERATARLGARLVAQVRVWALLSLLVAIASVGGAITMVVVVSPCLIIPALAVGTAGLCVGHSALKVSGSLGANQSEVDVGLRRAAVIGVVCGLPSVLLMVPAVAELEALGIALVGLLSTPMAFGLWSLHLRRSVRTAWSQRDGVGQGDQ